MTLFDEWLEEHKTEIALPERMRQMRARFGKRDDRKCGNCTHFYIHGRAGRYFKCDLNRCSGGPGTDWKFKWPACGKFEERKDE